MPMIDKTVAAFRIRTTSRLAQVPIDDASRASAACLVKAFRHDGAMLSEKRFLTGMPPAENQRGNHQAAPPFKWSIADVVDFEFFLSEDKDRNEQELADRDRGIFSKKIRPHLDAVDLEARDKIWLWLKARREGEPDQGQELPGQYFKGAYHLLLFILCASGLFLGTGIDVSHLAYYGDKPINTMVFLAFTVLPQVVLLIMVGLGLLFENPLHGFLNFTLIRWILRSVFASLVMARETADNHMGGEKRQRFRAIWGAIQAKQTIYGDIWLWPLLILTQTFAVCFNIAVIVTMLLLVALTNRAFGWETSLTFGPEAMYRVVKGIASPWSWLLPVAHPTLQQVIQSHISLLGSGAYPDEALVSWWPFLCYTVTFWGLFPRVALLITARVKERRTLDALPFNHADCNQLIRRMEPRVVAGPPGPSLSMEGAFDQRRPSSWDSNRCITIVSADMSLSGALLDRCLTQHGWETGARITAEVDFVGANEDLYELLRKFDWNGAQPKIVVVMDTDRPPIKAILLFLAKLRSVSGSTAEITVFLAASDNSKDQYSAIWDKTLRAIHDPYLKVTFGACQ